MLQRAEVINYFVTRFGYRRYLEIGVEARVTFNEVNVPEKTAVDPHFKIARDLLRGASFETTSDAFFDDNPRANFDLIFIDGLHTFEQSLRDFTRSLSRISENGLILIDDCYPSDYLASLRDYTLCQKAKSFEGTRIEIGWATYTKLFCSLPIILTTFLCPTSTRQWELSRFGRSNEKSQNGSRPSRRSIAASLRVLNSNSPQPFQ